MDAAGRIEARIKETGGWKGELLARLRRLIHEADPEVREEWKWDTPVFSHDGMVCSLGAFKDHVKLNFFKGAKIPDPRGLFNAGLQARTTRSINFKENDPVNEKALKELIREGIRLNG
jgi:hypothetical protein